MDTLEKLFGGSAKVKTMKLFLFHPDRSFGIDEIRKRCQVSSSKIRKEMLALEKMDFIKPRTIQVPSANGKNKKKVRGWKLNEDFPYMEPLKNLLVYTSPFANKDIVQKLKNTCTLKFLAISGIFIQDWESRIDLLIVGDNLKMNNLYSSIKALEADLGRELRYSIFETSDFLYRLNMCDKLVRDILDYSHKKIINKLNV